MNKPNTLSARPFTLRPLAGSRLMSLGLGLMLASSAVACVSESEVDDPITEQAQALDAAPGADLDESPEGERHGPRGHHGKRQRRGPHALLHVALEKLDLTAAQRRTLEAEQTSLREGMRRDHHPEDFQEKATQLADAVRAGTVDPGALGIDAGAHEARMRTGHARLAAALDTLHETLSPEQRAELVTTLKDRHEMRKAKRDERRARRGKRGGEGPERSRARRRKGGDEGGRAHRRHRARGPLGFMLRGLDVTDAQRASIEAGLEEAGLRPDREAMKERFAAMKERHEAMLDAFAGDAFDAATALPAPPTELARGPQRMVETLAVVVPLLDDAQREELALRIEEGPTMMHGKRGRAGKRRGHGHRGGERRR